MTPMNTNEWTFSHFWFVDLSGYKTRNPSPTQASRDPQHRREVSSDSSLNPSRFGEDWILDVQVQDWILDILVIHPQRGPLLECTKIRQYHREASPDSPLQSGWVKIGFSRSQLAKGHTPGGPAWWVYNSDKNLRRALLKGMSPEAVNWTINVPGYC